MAARYISVIYPFGTEEERKTLDIDAQFTDNEDGIAGTFHLEGVSIQVAINGTKYTLSSK